MGGRFARNVPSHRVEVREDFEIGIFQVTQNFWQAVMGSEWSKCAFQGENNPVEHVGWDDIRGSGGFFDKLNESCFGKQNMDIEGEFCLPSEAQWEYAARGGKYEGLTSYSYAGSTYLEEVGWYRGNSESCTHTVGQKHPNVLGLYDMSGNVWEWVEDDWHFDYRGAPGVEEPWLESPRNNLHIYRGGSWYSHPEHSEVSYRHSADHWNMNISFMDPLGDRNHGFRIARKLSKMK